MRWIAGVWAVGHAAASLNCDAVFPRLSCGLRNNNPATCALAGCCWEAETSECFAPEIYGYKYQQVEEQPGRTSGTLSLNKPSGITFGEDYADLDLVVTQETEHRTHIKVSPTDTTAWEVPEFLIPRPGGIYDGSDAATKTIITSQQDRDRYDSMELFVSRQLDGKPTSEILLVLTKMLVFQEQYVQFVLGTPDDVIATYGFGESSRLSQPLQNNITYTLWNTDMPAANFEESLYGSHPFYLQVSKSGKAHGVLFLSSNAMDVTLSRSESQGATIGVQATGGLLDLYVFAGPSPTDVVRQYLEVIGRPAMVPYWSLGFHNCRWGYPNVQYVADVVHNYSAAGIPLETQWVDIDYMDNYKDFTLDPNSFPQEEVQNLLKSLHENNQRFIPIVDPAIYVGDSSYESFQRGVEKQVFVKDLTGENEYLGQVWPGPTYFPDWFASNTSEYWQQELKFFHDIMEFDGIWIDMNEVSNFCNYGGAGQVCSLRDRSKCEWNVCCLKCETVASDNKFDFPPFVPHTVMKSLGGRTLPMSAQHAGGNFEYNVHNLHGMMESIATYDAVKYILKERPFVLSRSTFLGSGKYAAHWTGDNAATWDDLAVSIVTMNNMALFGIPMVGADICGFQQTTTEELCARWIQVGAFSPFSRNHNIRKAEPQELYRWDSVADISRRVLNLRYRLLPYLYTLMYKAHSVGNTVHNGLWMNFPTDPNTFAQDHQYMWSDGILFSPVLQEGENQVTAYFPTSIWYSLFSDVAIDASKGGFYLTLDTPLTETNVHVRGGTIVPMQESALTTVAARKTPFTILVALNADGKSFGELFIDDGLQVDIIKYATVEYSVSSNVLRSQVTQNSIDTKWTGIHFIILGIDLSAETLCTSELSTPETIVTGPASVTKTKMNDNFSKLDIYFDSVSLVSDYELRWTC